MLETYVYTVATISFHRFRVWHHQIAKQSDKWLYQRMMKWYPGLTRKDRLSPGNDFLVHLIR